MGRCTRQYTFFLISAIILIFLPDFKVHAQISTEENESKHDNTTSKLNKKRLSAGIAVSATTYALSTAVLYQSWYKDYPRSGFHFINDWGEWRNVDKTGHIFSGYFQSELAYKGWKWMGMNQKSAIWAGAATGFLAQTTIEVMDGFSEQWGFSIPDFASNIVGIGAFALQHSVWDEQRIRFKTSSSSIDYEKRYGSKEFAVRVDELYGSHGITRFLKDYNAQTTWLSVNLKSFFPESSLPEWLNVAVGYGAENMFGGYSNTGIPNIDAQNLQRYSQFYLSLDVDFSKIETDSPVLRTFLDVMNILKVPFSTIEFNTLGEVRFLVVKF